MEDRQQIMKRIQQCANQYPLYSQDGKRLDAVCSLVFFMGSVRWYVLEAEICPDGKVLMFGIVTGFVEAEYGYFTLGELESYSTPVKMLRGETDSKGMIVEVKPQMDMKHKPCPIRQLADSDTELHAFLNWLYPDNEDDGTEE